MMSNVSFSDSRTSSSRSLATAEVKVPDLICLSHVRWGFVYQRPQHLLTRCAKNRRVFFFEEPVFENGSPRLVLRQEGEKLFVAVPHLPYGLGEQKVTELQQALLDDLLRKQNIRSYLTWYYTPMALKYTAHLRPVASVYDCMDEWSHFKHAPRELATLEKELFKRVDVVFTGGQSLYEAKQASHPHTFAFPSSVDVGHFVRARVATEEPADQMHLARPRVGYVGVIDERIDFELIEKMADLRPDLQIVMVGPVVKIDPESLPVRANIHYLGGKAYEDLPRYLGSWDVAMLPFVRNEATKYISPTKTPEYLAAGRRVVSTSITDVVRPYGDLDLVSVADSAEGFVAAIDRFLSSSRAGYASWLQRVDTFLATMSWDNTFQDMWSLVEDAVTSREEYFEQYRKAEQVGQEDFAFGYPLSAAMS